MRLILKKENKSYYIVKENREQRFINVLNYLKINFPHYFLNYSVFSFNFVKIIKFIVAKKVINAFIRE